MHNMNTFYMKKENYYYTFHINLQITYLSAMELPFVIVYWNHSIDAQYEYILCEKGDCYYTLHIKLQMTYLFAMELPLA